MSHKVFDMVIFPEYKLKASLYWAVFNDILKDLNLVCFDFFFFFCNSECIFNVVNVSNFTHFPGELFKKRKKKGITASFSKLLEHIHSF